MKLVRHRKSSSVSRRKLRNRRNKSGSRKKYTHTHTHTIKGGCWGKKGGARSRRYGHKRTHKRGKRFHRGGETPIDEIQNRISNMALNHEGLYTLGDNNFFINLPTISLRYKKQGLFPPQTDEFYLNVIYAKNNNPDGNFTITLRRLPATQDGPYFEYAGNLLTPDSAELIVKNEPKQESGNIKNRLYNFNYPDVNSDKLKTIIDTIKSFIRNLTQEQVPSSTNPVNDPSKIN